MCVNPQPLISMAVQELFMPKSGGYKKLKCYKLAECICDLNYIFVKRYVPKHSRTVDQMEQAARSGKQNIAEGSAASASSTETEIKLTNVAKASFEELKVDYEDYLRQHNLERWGQHHPRQFQLIQYLRSARFETNPIEFGNSMPAEDFCNLMITLISQCQYLIGRLLESQQRRFLANGGLREAMYNARVKARGG